MKLKHITLILLFLNTFHILSQDKKEKKVILFNKQEMTFKQNIFYINGITFKYHKEKKYVKYDSIKNFISNLKVMNSDIKKSDIYDSKNNPSFYYSTFYDIYIYVIKKKQNWFSLSCGKNLAY